MNVTTQSARQLVLGTLLVLGAAAACGAQTEARERVCDRGDTPGDGSGCRIAVQRRSTRRPHYGTYYAIWIEIDTLTSTIAGSARLTLSHRSGGVVRLRLADSLRVDSVRVNGKDGTFVRRGPIVSVRTGDEASVVRPLGRVDVQVFYHGRADTSGFSFEPHDGHAGGASYGLPYEASSWWPTPGSTLAKADSADVLITVPSSLTAASNGVLVARVAGPAGQTTYHWATRFPIYPDVISVAIADYRELTDSALVGRQRIPLHFYVFPADSAKAGADFAVLSRILPFFVERFGPYPFATEKYGVAEFARPSYREHQTIPSLGAKFITGDHQYERVLAHELAHQWFGNSLSVRSWSDAWMNEGFATYAALLWKEHSRGRSAYDEAIAELSRRPYEKTLVVPDTTDVDDMFTPTTFNKAALMLHALRLRMGDAAFFAALHEYATQHAYGIVTPADFERVVAKYCGSRLDAFFTTWITGTGALPALTPAANERCPTGQVSR